MSGHLTHGSLFAGIGGFELAASEAGIKTLWNCEIEPYPRLVLKARFPSVKQYGDIRKLRGGEVEPVDIITFGSPCQSFSQAGARQGLDGASGLFYEAVRIIREMREATSNLFPRYAVMENVPGIYSSKSQGKSDFREVLNELLKIKDESVDVPLPEDGKFLTAGAVVGDGYSLAWRTLCASQFGVAQRRRRMFLVVSFADERAAEILSEPEGEGRNFTPGYRKGQGAAGGAEAGAGGVVAFEPGALQRLDKSAWENQARTLRADMGDNQTAVAYAYPLDLRNAGRVTDGGQGLGLGEDGDSAFTITAEYQHGVAAVEKKHKLGIDKVVQHNKWSGKNCPAELRSGAWGMTWDEFIGMVRGNLDTASDMDIPIIGNATASREQAEVWAKSMGATETFVSLARKYWDYAPANGGINPLIAFCQAALETGYGKFGGVLDESFHNPCGMKTAKGGGDNDQNAHERFVSWEDGVKAHLEHLALYAGAVGYPEPNPYDPRHFPYLLGKGKTLKTMFDGWCPGNKDYASILKVMMDKVAAMNIPAEPMAMDVTSAIAILVKHGVINSPDYWLANYFKLEYLDLLIISMAAKLAS